MTRSTLVVLALVVSACGSEEAERQLQQQTAQVQATAPAPLEAPQVTPEHAAQLQQQGQAPIPVVAPSELAQPSPVALGREGVHTTDELDRP